MRNRSVPTDGLLPHVIYEDVGAACAWLSSAFGFVEHYRYGDPSRPDGIQMSCPGGYLMLAKARGANATPSQIGRKTQYLTLFVDDVESAHERAKAAGARITEELNEPFYGERQFGVEDLEGHFWLISQHVRDVHPTEWGATVTDVASAV